MIPPSPPSPASVSPPSPASPLLPPPPPIPPPSVWPVRGPSSQRVPLQNWSLGQFSSLWQGAPVTGGWQESGNVRSSAQPSSRSASRPFDWLRVNGVFGGVVAMGYSGEPTM